MVRWMVQDGLPHLASKTMSAIRNFLLVFDHATDTLIGEFDCGDERAYATEEYARLEHMYSDDQSNCVVLVRADFLEAVNNTHANYFGGPSRRLMHDAFTLFVSLGLEKTVMVLQPARYLSSGLLAYTLARLERRKGLRLHFYSRDIIWSHRTTTQFWTEY